MNDFLKNSKLGRKLGVKGLYITMGACLIALAGAGTAAYNKAVSDITDSIVIDRPEPVQPADNKTSGVPKDTASKSKTSSSSAADDSSSQADSSSDGITVTERDDSSKISDTIKTQPNIMPVSGDVINPFSNGELVKDATLGVWKTHDGVDIKADAGAPVKAMNKGTITEIKQDPLWGNCIIIDHGSNVYGYYYSLSKAMNVTEGSEVNAGDVIGTVGDTAECESSELSHLHFGIKKNGSWIDPLEYIGAVSSK